MEKNKIKKKFDFRKILTIKMKSFAELTENSPLQNTK